MLLYPDEYGDVRVYGDVYAEAFLVASVERDSGFAGSDGAAAEVAASTLELAAGIEAIYL